MRVVSPKQNAKHVNLHRKVRRLAMCVKRHDQLTAGVKLDKMAPLITFYNVKFSQTNHTIKSFHEVD